MWDNGFHQTKTCAVSCVLETLQGCSRSRQEKVSRTGSFQCDLSPYELLKFHFNVEQRSQLPTPAAKVASLSRNTLCLLSKGMVWGDVGDLAALLQLIRQDNVSFQPAFGVPVPWLCHQLGV